MIESVTKNGKRTSQIVEKLGTHTELLEKLNGEDPETWCRAYIEKYNKKEAEKKPIIIKFNQEKQIDKDAQRFYQGGYLFLQKVFYELGFDKMCRDISNRHAYKYDLTSIFASLIYSRILDPGSKLNTYKTSKEFIEPHHFDLHQIYRALNVISEESDFIQSTMYKNSKEVIERNTDVLYYDCTNFFFEIEEDDDFRKYGKSKENRPNPLVQMGLFMDGNGIPLAFEMNPGNKNEQLTLKPLEKKIIKDFELSQFVVCTDAGLSSKNNRKFNNMHGRKFVTTTSAKKMKAHIHEWAYQNKGWSIIRNEGNKDIVAKDIANHPDIQKEGYDVTKINEADHFNSIFFKERWINEDGLEQRIIITFSLKYKNYLSKIRDKQIERAEKKIAQGTKALKKKSTNDCRRFIKEEHCTSDGEKAETTITSIDQEAIATEAFYDGYYAVATNMEDPIGKIITINQRRWEIEECFRIMKSEFKARPTYVRQEDRIKAHFMTCFIALLVSRLLEKKLDITLEKKYGEKVGEKSDTKSKQVANYNADKWFTYHEMFEGLRGMNFVKTSADDYIPAYTRTDLTDLLHETFGFRTDFEIISKKNMKNILKITKTPK